MLTPGQIARRLLGRYFEPVGNVYRRVFVDLSKIVDFLGRELPPGARLLDIGGGDGALVERLLNKRPDLNVTMCDIAPAIGSFLSDANRSKVRLFPATAFNDLPGPYDVVTICDVMHHVPLAEREAFFSSLAQSCQEWGCRKIVFKDVEPGPFRATLSLWADWYITGDKHVVLFSRDHFAAMARRYFPNAARTSAMPDWPNYGEVLTW